MPGIKGPCDSKQTSRASGGPVRCQVAQEQALLVGNQAESRKSGRHQRKGEMKEVKRHPAGSSRASCGESPTEHKAVSPRPSHGEPSLHKGLSTEGQFQKGRRRLWSIARQKRQRDTLHLKKQPRALYRPGHHAGT